MNDTEEIKSKEIIFKCDDYSAKCPNCGVRVGQYHSQECGKDKKDENEENSIN